MANGTTSGQQAALSRMRQQSQQWQTQERARMEAGRAQALNPGATVSYTIPEYTSPPQEALDILSQITSQDPYAGVHQAYEDVARQMAGAFQQRGSQGARTQQQAALSTGLTPLEASGAGESTLLENMRSYFAALPQLRLQQAMLPAQRQEQLGGLLGIIQQLYSQPGGQTQYTFPGQQQQAATTQTGQQTAGGGAGTALEQAQAMLAKAQAAQLQQVTSARQKMNELFYSGGLGPITAGGMDTSAGAWPSQYGPVAQGGATPAPTAAKQTQAMTGQQILDLVRKGLSPSGGATT